MAVNAKQVIVLIIEFIYICFGFKIFLILLPNFFSNDRSLKFLAYSEFTLLINKAETFLKLPVWSRNYQPCYSPKSEITCGQLLKAYKTLKTWSNLTFNDRPDYAALHISPKAGLGNAAYHILSGLVMGIALNRSVWINHPIDGIDYDLSLNRTEDYHCKKFGHIPIRNLENWQRFTYEQLKTEPCHLTATFCYPYFIFTEPGFAKFTYEHFGVHFAYFILNFAIPIKKEIRNHVFDIISTVPPSVKLIGVHIRTHKGRWAAFITNLEKIKQVVVPFLNDLLESKNYVALATDWTHVITLFDEKYHSRLIMTDVERKPDGNKYGASTDILFLMICNKMIGTHRSSFSNLAAQRACHRAYYVAMEYPTLFQFSNSQIGITSGFYEYLSDYNYFANRRMRLNPVTEEGIRLFYRNLMF